MDLEYLRDLMSVVDHGGFSKAAAERGLTQSTLSKHVIALEHEVGTALLDRGGKSGQTVPTPVGRFFIARAREIIIAYDALMKDTKALKGEEASALRVGTFVGYRPMDDILYAVGQELGSRYPLLDLVVEDIRYASALDLLAEGALDVVAMHCPLDLDRSRFDAVDLYHEPLGIFVKKGHRLAGRKSIRLADLDGETIAEADAPAASDSARLIRSIIDRGGCRVSYKVVPWISTSDFVHLGCKDVVYLNGAGGLMGSSPATVVSGYESLIVEDSDAVLTESLIFCRERKSSAMELFIQTVMRVVDETDMSSYWGGKV